MVRHFIDTVIGDVADGYSPGRGGFQVDVVDPDPVTHDHFRLGHGLDDPSSHGGELGDDLVAVRGQGDQVILRLALTVHDGMAAWLQDPAFDGEVGEGVIGNGDPAHPAGRVPRAVTRWRIEITRTTFRARL